MPNAWLCQGNTYWAIEEASALDAAGTRERVEFSGRGGMLRLLYAQSGTCWVSYKSEDVCLSGARMLLADGGAACLFRDVSPGAELVLVDFVPVRGPAVGDSLKELWEKYAAYRRFSQSEDSHLVFEDSHALIASMLPGLRAACRLPRSERSSLMGLYASYIILVMVCAAEADARPSGTGNCHVRRAIGYLSAHCAEPGLSLPDAAAYAGVHPAHLGRLFRAETGMRVCDYLTGLRMERVRFLLMHTDFTLERIARLTGFSSAQYLSNLFRAREGETPGRYRRNMDITCRYSDKYYTVSWEGASAR